MLFLTQIKLYSLQQTPCLLQLFLQVVELSCWFSFQPPKKMTAAQKSLAKVDKSGMKTMSSFFSPKVKAEQK